MREIKFRSWNIDAKIMHDVAFPSWNGTHEVWQDNKPQTETIYLSNGPAEEGILMQYTGLKDKNGKEGYHKDIVRSGKKLFIIEWQDEEARFWLAPAGDNTGTWKHMDELIHMEIIGNVPQHPELLK